MNFQALMNGAGTLLKSDSFWKGVGTLGQGYLGYQNYRMGKQAFGMQKQQFQMQKDAYNRQLGYEQDNRQLYFGG